MKRTIKLNARLCMLAMIGIFAMPAICFADNTPPKTVASAALPGDSVYRLQAEMTDQDGRTFKLEERRGKPVLVSMFYNSCQFVCPMLIDTVSSTEQQLTAEERAKLSITLITFDPARDDVKSLKSIAEKRNLDAAHWTLARSDAASVRKLAATLGIQYRLLPDGEFNHTTVLVLLDGDGRIVGRTKKIGAVDPDFVKLVKRAIQQSKTAK
jgi:protein SCO1/2